MEQVFKNTEITGLKKEIIKKDNFEVKKNEFLEYMVQDEVYFADLEKIEDYYLRGTVASYKNVNDNLKELNQKKLLLEKLQIRIESVILN